LKNQTKDEQLEGMLSELDPPYESIEELKIGRLLDKYGIPFFYKQATIVYDQGKNRIAKPSFTLLSYGGAVIDYVNATEEQKLLQKEQLYRYNQILSSKIIDCIVAIHMIYNKHVHFLISCFPL